MATILSKFADILSGVDFDVDDQPDGSDDVGIAEYIEKIEAIQDKVAGLGCMVGCLPAYLQCKKDNPTYPPQVICDSLLAGCLENCNQV